MSSPKALLQIPHRINLIPHIILQIDPKGEDHVDNNRRSKSEKCDIHEEEAHTTGGNTHFLAQPRANTKGARFDKMFEFV